MQNLCFFMRSLLVLAIFCALSQIAFAAPDGPVRPRAGVSNSSGNRRLNASQLQQAIDSLRHKTGFLEMRFDESGLLTLGDRTRFEGGSATARELLIASVDGRKALELGAYNHSPDIAFACITAGAIFTNFQTKARIEVWQVRLDFADFVELRGDREARAAFDPGFALLHELAHGVLGLADAVGETAKLGECDELINRMRRELNLPERQSYSARTESKLAELVFTRERTEPSRAGTERFYLRWEAKRVASATKSKHATS